MKVLIVNTSDIDGGAARATYRIHRSLLELGVDSKMLVLKKDSDDYTVLTEPNKIKKKLNQLLPFFDSIPTRFYTNRSKTLYSCSLIGSKSLIREINRINPDIVHLHWICGGMIRFGDLSKINAPIIWGLLDMWAFTGGCHYDEWCGGYKNKCGNCKVLGSQKEKDISRFVFNKKKHLYDNMPKMTIVGHSQWLANSARSSHLLRNHKIVNIPSTINTENFRLFPKIQSRNLWKLPPGKKLILFGAVSAVNDPRKGFKELSEALKTLTDQDMELVVFGSSEPPEPQGFKFKTHYLGPLSDDVSLVTLYNAVDVMIVPSLQENLSNAILESLACGTPVVSFDIGGNSDLIDHKENGYLAKPFDPKKLAEGIEWVLNNSDYDDLCQKAREKVVREFDSKVVAKKYIDLYNEVIK